MEGLLARLRAVVGPHATDEALRAVLGSANNNLEIATSMYFEMHHFRESKVEAAHSKVLALKPPKSTPASLMASFLGQSGAPPPSAQMTLGSGKSAPAGASSSARGDEATMASIGPHRNGAAKPGTTGHSRILTATAVAAGRSADGGRVAGGTICRDDDDRPEVDGLGNKDDVDVIDLDSSQASEREELAAKAASSTARAGARISSQAVPCALASASGEAPLRRAETPPRPLVGYSSAAGAGAGQPWSSPSGPWPKALKPIFVATHR
jgi:hypothetical protein